MTKFNGQALKKILKDRGIPVKEFIVMMGWKSYTQFASFIDGNPTASSIAKVASLLSISVSALFEDDLESGVVNNNYGSTATQSGDINMNIGDTKGVDELKAILTEKSGKERMAERLIDHLEKENARLLAEIEQLRSKL